MDTPKTLNGYFAVVDDFFKKTFRSDDRLFVAVKTRQYADVATGDALLFSGESSRGAAAMESARATVAQANLSGQAPRDAGWVPNQIRLSPRMAIRRDGTALGKVKLACEVDVPRVCRLEQGLILNSDGVVAAKALVRELMEGLVLTGRIAVNTIAPASQDVTSLYVHYGRSDFYSSVGYQRNGLGSSNLLVDCGTTFFNLLIGAGFERQKLSYLEQQEGQDQLDVMYAGLGFSGFNWSVAAKMIRTSDAWSSARLAIMQKLTPTTVVACNYEYDLPRTIAHVGLGFSQGFEVRLPEFIRSRQLQGEPVAGSTLPLVLAAKVESSGRSSATIRGVINNVLHWGLVAEKNAKIAESPMRYGLVLSLEAES